MRSVLSTEFEFTLPVGYRDEWGDLHRDGTMRLATMADEIVPMRDPRAIADPAFAEVIRLSRVVTRLGTLDMISPRVIEQLMPADRAYLRAFYSAINCNDESAPVLG